jgi:hypothetical protein
LKKLNTILLLLGLVFLICLVWRIGVGQLWRQLAALGWGVVFLILGEGAAELIHSAAWRPCLSGPLRSLPLFCLFRIRMAGYAINYLTPTAALGGELTKSSLLASKYRGYEAISGVLIEKACLALAHLLFVVLGGAVLLWRVVLPRALWLAMLSTSLLVAVGIVVFFQLQKHGKLGVVLRWLAARRIGGRVVEKAAGGITQVDEALKSYYRERPWDLVLSVLGHMVAFTVGIGQTWLFFRLANRDASLGVAAAAWILGMWFDLVTFAVPLNLGTLEGTRTVGLKAIGYDAVLGMAYGVTQRFAQLFWAGFGLANHALLISKERRLAAEKVPGRRADAPEVISKSN